MGELSDLESDLTSLGDSDGEYLESDAMAISSEDDAPKSKSKSKSKATAKSKSTSATKPKAKAKAGGAGKGKSSAAARQKRGEYVLANTLSRFRMTTYSAQALYDQIHDNTIDLDPEYQRDVVWTDAKQSGLIDSVLRNYYLPPVIFAVIADSDGTEKRTCIDGKQRLTSIQKFMDGLIPHKDSVTGRRYWYKSSSAKDNVLPKHYIQQFAQKQIACIEYDKLTPDQEREIFQRVQLGVALTPAERMQALTGPMATFIRKIKDFLEGRDGFNDKLEWSEGRGRMFQCLCMIVHIVGSSAPAESKWPTIPSLEKWLQHPDGPTDRFHDAVMDTFRVFVFLVRSREYSAPFKTRSELGARLSPMEFIMTGILIYHQMKTLGAAQLSEAVTKMRKQVRGKYDDIRMNAKVARTMLDYVKSYQGAGAGTEESALKQAKAWEENARGVDARSKKRKKMETESEESSEEEESEDEPLARRKIVAKPKGKAVVSSSKTASSKPTPATKKPRKAVVELETTPPPPVKKKSSTKGAESSKTKTQSKSSSSAARASAASPAIPSRPPSSASTSKSKALPRSQPITPKIEPMDIELIDAPSAPIPRTTAASRLAALRTAKTEPSVVSLPPPLPAPPPPPPPPVVPLPAPLPSLVTTYAPGDPRARRLSSFSISATQSPATEPPPTPLNAFSQPNGFHRTSPPTPVVAVAPTPWAHQHASVSASAPPPPVPPSPSAVDPVAMQAFLQNLHPPPNQSVPSQPSPPSTNGWVNSFVPAFPTTGSASSPRPNSTTTSPQQPLMYPRSMAPPSSTSPSQPSPYNGSYSAPPNGSQYSPPTGYGPGSTRGRYDSPDTFSGHPTISNRGAGDERYDSRRPSGNRDRERDRIRDGERERDWDRGRGYDHERREGSGSRFGDRPYRGGYRGSDRGGRGRGYFRGGY